MTKQEAYEKISALCAEAKAKIKEAERLADQHGSSFSFQVSYGMGGTYNPKTSSDDRKEALAKLSERERRALGLREDDTEEEERGGWESSSQNC
jgi:predicted NUDIX family phosphoesterase